MNKERKKELDTLLNADNEEEKEEEKNKDDKSEESDEKKDEEKDEKEEKEEEENDEQEEESEEDEKNKKEKADAEEEEKNKKEEEESEDEEEVEKDKEEEDAKNKDKWHGKSREEVIRMYEELENKKPTEIKTPDTEVRKKDKADENNSDDVEVPSDEELAKMTPKQFAQWMVSTVKNIVSETYDSRTQMRDSVTQEIRDAKKDHPLLKTSPEYRELVLSLIDTASRKGTVISLSDACAKVDEFVGKVKGDTKVTETEKIRLKKAKAQVERGAGAPTSHGEEKGAEERRLEQIFGTSGSKSPLGGLGV